MPMDDEERVGVEAKLELIVGHLNDAKDRLSKLEAFQYSAFETAAPQTITAGTGPTVVPIYSPPMGFWALVRQVRVTGVTIGAVAGVNVDLYVTSRQSVVVPPVSDWRGSTGTSTSAPGLPVLLTPGSREVPVQPGEWITVVLSGSGVVTGAQFQASVLVERFQALANLIRTGGYR
jgi:hypothetical protein